MSLIIRPIDPHLPCSFSEEPIRITFRHLHSGYGDHYPPPTLAHLKWQGRNLIPIAKSLTTKGSATINFYKSHQLKKFLATIRHLPNTDWKRDEYTPIHNSTYTVYSVYTRPAILGVIYIVRFTLPSENN
jgi:hypothetical protein